jgi:glycosyltransferase involved in cell wall biosynthesis
MMAQLGATELEPAQPAPKVSVFILTYNHVAWIAQALESAVSQEVPFAYEIVVADDCSSDGTREIVREYERRHPGLIRTFLPESNLGVRGIWPAAARSCRGEYVAVLEGDDYWTSPNKLATQAALLDARPGWTSCFHRATLFHDDGSAPRRPATPALAREAFELEDLLRACFIPFLTVMFRRRALDGVPAWVFTYAWFDWLFHIYCARQGSIGFLDEDMAEYRVHRGGNWSARDRSAQLEEDLRTYERLVEELPEHGPLIRRSVEQRHCQLAVEQGAVRSDTAIAVFDPVGDMPVYYNGRHAEPFGAGPRGLTVAERLSAIVRAAAERPSPALHYGSHVAPESRWWDDSESLPRAGRCLCVIPRSTEESLAEESELADLLATAGEPAWSDEWCRIWVVEIDSPQDVRRKDKGVTETMGALVEIDEVNLLEPLPEQLRGGFVDQPRAGALLDAHAVDVLGWALGAQARATAAEFSIGGRPFCRAPLRVERPDLTEAFSGVPEAAQAGFRTTLNMIGTPAEFELTVSIVLRDQQRVELATITGRHRWRRDRSPAYSELVSVVIPCYAQAHFLGEAIESVLAQTYPHLEIVVIDDESMDNASSIASRYPGVRCVRERNSGMAGARNVGIRVTNGDFLVFLDADDRLLPEAIETGVRMLEEHPECAAAIGAYRRTTHDGRRLDTHSQPAVRSEQYSRLMRENWAGFPARAIYRRALFEHVRGFDADVDAAADFAFNLAVAREFPICSHEALVAEHREHGHNISANAAKMLVETLRALRQQRGYARRDPELRRAYHDGVHHWKSYWGGLLVGQARASWRERQLGDALRQVLLLARVHPRGVPRLLRRERSGSG